MPEQTPREYALSSLSQVSTTLREAARDARPLTPERLEALASLVEQAGRILGEEKR